MEEYVKYIKCNHFLDCLERLTIYGKEVNG